MNFAINNISFNAKYIVEGKNTSTQTGETYQAEINRLRTNKAIATQAQKYLGTPEIKSKIAKLPEDTFIRLYTGIINREDENRKDDFSASSPFLIFQSKPKDQGALEKAIGKNGDFLSLSLDKNKELDKKAIISWFDNLLNFYNS